MIYLFPDSSIGLFIDLLLPLFTLIVGFLYHKRTIPNLPEMVFITWLSLYLLPFNLLIFSFIYMALGEGFITLNIALILFVFMALLFPFYEIFKHKNQQKWKSILPVIGVLLTYFGGLDGPHFSFSVIIFSPALAISIAHYWWKLEPDKVSELSGMTANERLLHLGLLGVFDKALENKDEETLKVLLKQCEVPKARRKEIINEIRPQAPKKT